MRHRTTSAEHPLKISRRLLVSPQAPAAARAAVQEFAPAISARRLDDARLIVSELVTNCVLHAGLGGRDSIEINIELIAGRLRVEVLDQGCGFEASEPREAGQGRVGWGLTLVDRLADRWGRDEALGTKVWAEMAVP